MTATQWGILVPAVIGLISGIAGYLKAHNHAKNPVAHNVPMNQVSK